MLKNFPASFPVSSEAAASAALAFSGKVLLYISVGIVAMFVILGFVAGDIMKILQTSLGTLPLVFVAMFVGLLFGYFRNTSRAVRCSTPSTNGALRTSSGERVSTEGR